VNHCRWGLGWPSLAGLSSIREVPDDHHDPPAALIPVAPVFSNTERLALAGFLAGYRIRPRQGWCYARLDVPISSTRNTGWSLGSGSLVKHGSTVRPQTFR